MCHAQVDEQRSEQELCAAQTADQNRAARTKYGDEKTPGKIIQENSNSDLAGLRVTAELCG